jgi:hypothetical protein
VVAAGCLWQLSGRSWRPIATSQNSVFAAKVLGALCLEGAAIYLASLGIGDREERSWISLAVHSGIAGLCGLLTYSAASYWFGIREVGRVLPRALRARMAA